MNRFQFLSCLPFIGSYFKLKSNRVPLEDFKDIRYQHDKYFLIFDFAITGNVLLLNRDKYFKPPKECVCLLMDVMIIPRSNLPSQDNIKRHNFESNVVAKDAINYNMINNFYRAINDKLWEIDLDKVTSLRDKPNNLIIKISKEN